MTTLSWILAVCVATVPLVSAQNHVEQICGRQELTELRECAGAPDGCCCFLDRCTYFEPAERIDCGFPGIAQQTCEDKGCCYSEIPPIDFNFCWYPVCTKTNMDVCFLVDISGSIGQTILNNILGMVQGVANELTLGDTAIRTCIIPFNSVALPPNPPLAGNNPLIVPSLTSTGGTNAQVAFDAMQWQFIENGADGNCRVGVILTDGGFMTGVTTPPDVTVVVVGVSANSLFSQQNLEDVATGDGMKNVLISEDPVGADLVSDEFIQALRHLICCPDE